MVFLTQIRLTSRDNAVATALVECYVSLFEKAVKQNELGSKLLSALLNGINVAYPYLKDTEPLTKHLDSLFRLVHTSTFATATQALMLISLIAIGGSAASNRDAADAGRGKNKGAAARKQSAHKPATDSQSISSTEKTALMDRYYRALYSKLFSEDLTSRTRNTVFFNLLYRSMKLDASLPRCGDKAVQ